MPQSYESRQEGISIVRDLTNRLREMNKQLIGLVSVAGFRHRDASGHERKKSAGHGPLRQGRVACETHD